MKFLAWIAVLVLVFSVAMVVAMLIGRTLPLPPVLVVSVYHYTFAADIFDRHELYDLNRGLAVKINLPEGTDYTWSRDGQLAFERSGEIYLQHGQNEPVSLSNHQYRNWSPVWSLDGRLAFVSNRTSLEQVYVMEQNGSINRIETIAGSKSSLSWSVDGDIAVFVNLGAQMVIVGNDGSFRTIPDSLGLVWSPDQRLALVIRSGSAQADIQVIEPDGTVIEVTNDGQFRDEFPSWSQDGRLAWVRSDPARVSEILVWDGIEIINISNHPDYDGVPHWASDGRLLFHSRRDGNNEIYMWDGQSLYNLTQRPEQDFIVGWWYPH